MKALKVKERVNAETNLSGYKFANTHALRETCRSFIELRREASFSVGSEAGKVKF
jgi:hypothetical protein